MANMKPLTLLFFGSQGAGKGTQVQMLIDCLQTQGKQIGIYGANCEFLMFKSRNQKPGLVYNAKKEVLENALNWAGFQ